MHPHRKHKDTNSHHGTIRDVFGHRFVLSTDDGTILADVGPDAPEGVCPKPGAKVNITGKRTPSEIKVRLFQSGSNETIKIPHKLEKKRTRKEDGDSEAAVKVALGAGYIVEGEPKRKSKHFELQAIRGGHRYELHIMLNGDIRKEIPLHK